MKGMWVDVFLRCMYLSIIYTLCAMITKVGVGIQDFVGVEAHAAEGCLFLKVLLSCIGL